MQISEAELRRATKDLDEFHNETFPSFQRGLADWAEQERDESGPAPRRIASRRTFLLGGGVAAGGLVLAACGSSSKKSSPTTAAPTGGSSAPSSSASGGGSADKAIATTAASLENLAVAAYAMAIQAATAGKLGTVPPAVVTFATTAKMQHTAHAGAFNSVVTAAGGQAYTQPDPAVLPTVQAAFAKVTTVPQLAMLALELESVAANTYFNDLGMAIKSPQLIGALSTIQPVERQHEAILNFVLGQYPVPQTFQSAQSGTPNAARPPTDVPT
ncbi:MAG: ferritin-like domain-containing protein [Actinomycetota bacterium]|nr:ferritin-like domain-containing protein [Actinomycetota bacterium]